MGFWYLFIEVKAKYVSKYIESQYIFNVTSFSTALEYGRKTIPFFQCIINPGYLILGLNFSARVCEATIGY